MVCFKISFRVSGRYELGWLMDIVGKSNWKSNRKRNIIGSKNTNITNKMKQITKRTLLDTKEYFF
jgi:hypothetical protein